MATATDDGISIKQVGLIAVSVFLLLFVVAAGCSSFVTVPAGNRAVVTHFGKVQNVILDEGFHLITPFVAKTYNMSVRLKLDRVKVSAASKDLQEIQGDIAVNWNIDPKDVAKIYQGIGSIDTVVQAVMVPATNEIFKRITAEYSAEQILTKRAELKTKLDDDLKARLHKYDIVLIDASIQHIDFSKEFNAAIEQKQIAEQSAQKARYVADQAKQEAEAEINRAKGKAEAMKLMAITVSPKILQQQAIEKWNGVLPQYIGGNAPVPFIDVKSLKAESSR